MPDDCPGLAWNGGAGPGFPAGGTQDRAARGRARLGGGRRPREAAGRRPGPAQGTQGRGLCPDAARCRGRRREGPGGRAERGDRPGAAKVHGLRAALSRPAVDQGQAQRPDRRRHRVLPQARPPDRRRHRAPAGNHQRRGPARPARGARRLGHGRGQPLVLQQGTRFLRAPAGRRAFHQLAPSCKATSTG